MYETNREEPHNGLYNDIGIYTNEICVFKLDRDGEFIEPFYPSVISCPAPNKNHALKCGIEEESILHKLRDRIKLIFEMACSHKVNILILGAYGTGVFGNDTLDVKNIFNELLENEYANCFEKIIYAIPDEEKYDLFKKID
jgi:uncharacterized protein (TIGR02452 family)